MADTTTPQFDEARAAGPLSYASRPPRSSAVIDASYWAIDIVLGLLNALFNAVCIVWAIGTAHDAALSAKLLLISPSAFGRQVDAASIVRLQNSAVLWVPAIAVCLSAVFGLFLAMRLLMLGWYLRTASPRIVPTAMAYRRFKPIGIVLTCGSLYWLMSVEQDFWIAATRHVPIGTHSPTVEVAVVAIFALLPWRMFAGVRADSPVINHPVRVNV